MSKPIRRSVTASSHQMRTDPRCAMGCRRPQRGRALAAAAKQGFRGCMRVVSEWATRRRQADSSDHALSRAPAARTIARLMTIDRDRLTRSEAVTVAAIEGGVPLLIEAREIVAAFQALVRKRSLDALGPWLEGGAIQQGRHRGQAASPVPAQGRPAAIGRGLLVVKIKRSSPALTPGKSGGLGHDAGSFRLILSTRLYGGQAGPQRGIARRYATPPHNHARHTYKWICGAPHIRSPVTSTSFVDAAVRSSRRFGMTASGCRCTKRLDRDAFMRPQTIGGVVA